MCITLVIMANGKLSYYDSQTGFLLSPALGLTLCSLPLAAWVCPASVGNNIFRAKSSYPALTLTPGPVQLLVGTPALPQGYVSERW